MKTCIFYHFKVNTNSRHIFIPVSKLATKDFLWKAWCPSRNMHPLCSRRQKKLLQSPKLFLPLSAYSLYPTERGFLTPKTAFQRVLDGPKVKQPSVRTHFHHGKPTLRFHWPNVTFLLLLLHDFIRIGAPWPAAEFFLNRAAGFLARRLIPYQSDSNYFHQN